MLMLIFCRTVCGHSKQPFNSTVPISNKVKDCSVPTVSFFFFLWRSEDGGVMLAINFFPSINYYILLYRPWKIHDWSTSGLNTQTEVRLLLRSSWTPTRTLIVMPPPLDMSLPSTDHNILKSEAVQTVRSTYC